MPEPSIPRTVPPGDRAVAPVGTDELVAWLTIAGSPDARAAWWNGAGGGCAEPGAILARLRRGGVPLREPVAAQVERCRAWLERPGTCLIGWGHALYPQALAALDDPPALLFAEGDPSLLSALQVAIVGSRKPTPAGAEHAFRMARELAGAGITITSGLATGIDAAAHRGALASGARGATVGVPGAGPDLPYPREHRGLYREVARGGVIVSEFPPGIAARPHHFPRRNRIISGLSRAVVVVEAGLPSGTLITARHALAQGREVLAVPGSVGNAQARGCHALIRDGARLVEDAGQVLDELRTLPLPLGPAWPSPAGGPLRDGAPGLPGGADHCEDSTLPPSPSGRGRPDAKALAVLGSLGADPTDIDSVVERSGLTVSEVSSILASLELSGRVWAGPAGTFQRKPD